MQKSRFISFRQHLTKKKIYITNVYSTWIIKYLSSSSFEFRRVSRGCNALSSIPHVADFFLFFPSSFADEAFQHVHEHCFHWLNARHVATSICPARFITTTADNFHSRRFFTDPLLKRTKFAQSILISSVGMDVLTVRFFAGAAAAVIFVVDTFLPLPSALNELISLTSRRSSPSPFKRLQLFHLTAFVFDGWNGLSMLHFFTSLSPL